MFLRLSVLILALGAPFFAYWLHARLQARAVARWPVLHLLLIGAFNAAVFLALATFQGAGQGDQKFVPSHLENGVLKPGHFEKAAR